MLAENLGQVAGRLYTRDGDLYAHTLLTPDGPGVWPGSSRDTDRTRLVRLDLATGEEAEVDSHPVLDIDPRSTVFPTLPSPLICHRRSGGLLGVRYLGERQVIHPLDPYFAAVLDNLEKLSDGDLAAVSSDDSGQRWVAGCAHDRDLGVTYYYDHSTGDSRLLFRSFPLLDPKSLAPMTPVTIPARDGLALPSYLTLPVGVEPAGLPWCCWCTAAPGTATAGVATPWCSCWPTMATRCSRSTSAARPVTARCSSRPASGSRPGRCTTISSTPSTGPSTGPSRRDTRTASRSSAAPTAITPPWSASPPPTGPRQAEASGLTGRA